MQPQLPNSMKIPSHSFALLVLVFSHAWLGSLPILQAQSVSEYFNPTAFRTNAGFLRVIGFDSLAPGNNVLTGNEFVSDGIQVVARDGHGINVVQNTVPGSYGANFVTLANLNSLPNAISTSIMVNSASPTLPDNFDFILTPPARAAGLFVGNLGALVDQSTVVEFLDETNGIVAAETIYGDHPGVINGAVGVNWDNRIFYGAVSEIPIKTIRLSNPPNDGDGIVIDDVQFSAAVTLRVSRVGSEVHIRWPASISNGQLESAPSLITSPSSWQLVTNSPVLSANDWLVTKSAAASNEFFRLKSVP